jgi:hypothetical protein
VWFENIAPCLCASAMRRQAYSVYGGHLSLDAANGIYGGDPLLSRERCLHTVERP